MAAPHPVRDVPLVRVEDRGAIRTLTLDRPKHYNALSRAMLETLQAALDDTEQRDDLKILILAGAGPAFCAGHDLKEMRGLSRDDPDAEARYRELFEQCSAMMLSLARLPQSVIARVHGIATAAGCQLVGACDLAVASTEARFATSGINVGLFCATPAVALSRNVGRKRAFEMLMTGDFIDAGTACQLGLVNRVVAPDALDAAVDALAATIAAHPAVATRAGKALFYRQLELGTAAAYEEAGRVMACNMMEPDAVEGVDAFLEKRPPHGAGTPDEQRGNVAARPGQ